MDKFVGSVIVNTPRDRRAFEFLVEKCGMDAVEQACLKLSGQRRAYVSNIAKVLRVEIPDDVVVTPREEARKHLSDLKTLLAQKK
ncbi:hypothetical protein [Paraburkholderia tropica]|uniref:hypothetical protein n=1 Tax=Paraburkholderia tropica TaxID=92647 RepID=UPI002ABD3700|nr:hypothetical protein [Paraburkholderia tropica]